MIGFIQTQTQWYTTKAREIDAVVKELKTPSIHEKLRKYERALKTLTFTISMSEATLILGNNPQVVDVIVSLKAIKETIQKEYSRLYNIANPYGGIVGINYMVPEPNFNTYWKNVKLDDLFKKYNP